MYYGITAPDGTEVFPEKPDGSDGRWSRGEESVKELRESGNLKFENNRSDSWKIYRKERPYDEFGETKKEKYTSILDDVPLTEQGGKDLSSVIQGADDKFDFPKPVELIKKFVKSVTDDNDIVLDYFAGSGTTAQAVQELNRERDGQVNYIMVEMLDEAFDIIEERVKRTSYTKEWKSGHPQINSEEVNSELDFDAEILELESYNETLETLLHNESENRDIFDYSEEVLEYSLDFENALRENLVQIDEPTSSNYSVRSGNGVETIDMETTFNYLLGLQKVEKNQLMIGGIEYTVYQGIDRDRNRVKIVWRTGNTDSHDIDYNEEKDKIEDDSFDHVFVNGDSAIEDSRSISEKINSILKQGDNL